jgi:hypothetical protein
MDQDGFLSEMFAGSDMGYEAKTWVYNEETSELTLEVFVDCFPSAKYPDIVNMIAANLSQQFTKDSTSTHQSSQSVYFKCHLSDRNQGKKDKYKSKKTACPAKLSLTFYNKKSASRKSGRSGSTARAAPLPCLLRLQSTHNHAYSTARHRGLLYAPKALKTTFLVYFADRLGPGEALEENERRLRVDPTFAPIWLSDATKHPTYATVHWWHHNWRIKTYGGEDDAAVSLELANRAQKLLAQGIYVRHSATTNSVVILTPLMGRAHQEAWAGTQVFIDSTGACDRTGATVTTLSAVVPEIRMSVLVGIFITAGQTEDDYSEGLALLDSALDDYGKGGQGLVKWGGRGGQGPEFLMVDNSDAEINSCKGYWPQATVELCSFHTLKAAWRNVDSAKHKLGPQDKVTVYQAFKTLVNETDRFKFQTDWDRFRDELILANHGGLNAYFTRVYCGKEAMWALGYRSWKTRMNDTNNVSERAVQTIKQEVLRRLRAYNLIELVDVFASEVDEIYEGRLLRFSFGRDKKRDSVIDQLWNAGIAIPATDVNDVNQTITEVASQSVPGKVYQVNRVHGSCNCHVGFRGKCCKHMIGAQYHRNLDIPGVMSNSPKVRLMVATLASGPTGGHKIGNFLPVAPAPPPNIYLPNQDAPTELDGLDLGSPDVDVVVTGFDLSATAPASSANALSQADKETIHQRAVMLLRLSDTLGQKAARTHGAQQTIQAMDGLIAGMSKLGTGGAYMQWLQGQTGAAKANRRKKIGVNVAAIQRRKTPSGSRNPVRPGRPKKGRPKQHFHQRVGPPPPPAAAVAGVKHGSKVSPVKASQRQPSSKRSRSKSQQGAG